MWVSRVIARPVVVWLFLLALAFALLELTLFLLSARALAGTSSNHPRTWEAWFLLIVILMVAAAPMLMRWLFC
jgi:hypothetical protein